MESLHFGTLLGARGTGSGEIVRRIGETKNVGFPPIFFLVWSIQPFLSRFSGLKLVH